VASARGETSPVAPSWGSNLRAIRVPVRKYTAVSPILVPRSAFRRGCKRDPAFCTVDRPAFCTVGCCGGGPQSNLTGPTE
jgi:hypothetical protein